MNRANMIREERRNNKDRNCHDGKKDGKKDGRQGGRKGLRNLHGRTQEGMTDPRSLHGRKHGRRRDQRDRLDRTQEEKSKSNNHIHH